MEKFIGVMIVLVLAAIGFMVVQRCGGAAVNHEKATSAANEWVKQMGIDGAHVSCVNMDTDGDGYVSCTVGYKLNNGEIKTQAIECAAWLNLNEGCRVPKLNMIQSQ